MAKTQLRGGLGVCNSLMELDYTAETRSVRPSQNSFWVSICAASMGPGACGQPYAPSILTYQLGYTLGNQEPTAISSPPNIRNGYVYEWSLSYEHALGTNTVLSFSYTGSDGHKLPRRGLQNQGVPNLPGERLGYHPQPGSNQFVRATDVNSNFNALVARLEHRFSKQFSFVAGIPTPSRSIRHRAWTAPTSRRTTTTWLPSTVFPISTCDSALRFQGCGSCRSDPAADGQERVLPATCWADGKLLTSSQLQTGQPLTAVLATALSGTQSNGTDRPDLVLNPDLPASQRNPQRWFNTSAFAPPPIFTDSQGAFSIPGNEGRNVITGPGLAASDASLERRFRLTERFNTVFRAEFFNLTNHPNFDRPGLIVGTTQFGMISAADNSRQIQFSLRLNW